MRIQDVMSRDIISIAPGAPLSKARTHMKVGGVRHLIVESDHQMVGVLSERPVVDGGKPVGIVTTTDLLELLGRGVEKPIARSTRWTMRDRGARRSGPSARHARQG